jgi:hypothetical protein
MSRGGLLLRSVDSGCELEYAPLAGAMRHGPRPPRLPRRERRNPPPRAAVETRRSRGGAAR